MPWKDGGGKTVELAVHLEGAPVGGSGWRVGLARVTSDGPFSTFPGVDRSLAVLDGEGLSLAVGAGRPVRLTARDDARRFAGEAPCRARLLVGPVAALNAMVERGSFTCAVSRSHPAQEFRAEGEFDTDLGPLGPRDALVVSAGSAVRVGPRGTSARAVAASFRPLRPGGPGQR